MDAFTGEVFQENAIMGSKNGASRVIPAVAKSVINSFEPSTFTTHCSPLQPCPRDLMATMSSFKLKSGTLDAILVNSQQSWSRMLDTFRCRILSKVNPDQCWDPVFSVPPRWSLGRELIPVGNLDGGCWLNL